MQSARFFRVLVAAGMLFGMVLLVEADRPGLRKKEPVSQRKGFVYKRQGRDPFWPLVTKDGRLIRGFGSVSFENLYLEGIVWDPYGSSIAMISGLILREGDSIGDFEVLKIESNRVTLRTPEDEHRYLLLEEQF